MWFLKGVLLQKSLFLSWRQWSRGQRQQEQSRGDCGKRPDPSRPCKRQIPDLSLQKENNTVTLKTGRKGSLLSNCMPGCANFCECSCQYRGMLQTSWLDVISTGFVQLQCQCCDSLSYPCQGTQLTEKLTEKPQHWVWQHSPLGLMKRWISSLFC